MSEISKSQQEAIRRTASKAIGHVRVEFDDGSHEKILMFVDGSGWKPFANAVEGRITGLDERESVRPISLVDEGGGFGGLYYINNTSEPNALLHDLIDRVIAENHIPEKIVHAKRSQQEGPSNRFSCLKNPSFMRAARKMYKDWEKCQGRQHADGQATNDSAVGRLASQREKPPGKDSRRL